MGNCKEVVNSWPTSRFSHLRSLSFCLPLFRSTLPAEHTGVLFLSASLLWNPVMVPICTKETVFHTPIWARHLYMAIFGCEDATQRMLEHRPELKELCWPNSNTLPLWWLLQASVTVAYLKFLEFHQLLGTVLQTNEVSVMLQRWPIPSLDSAFCPHILFFRGLVLFSIPGVCFKVFVSCLGGHIWQRLGILDWLGLFPNLWEWGVIQHLKYNVSCVRVTSLALSVPGKHDTCAGHRTTCRSLFPLQGSGVNRDRQAPVASAFTHEDILSHWKPGQQNTLWEDRDLGNATSCCPACHFLASRYFSNTHFDLKCFDHPSPHNRQSAAAFRPSIGYCLEGKFES